MKDAKKTLTILADSGYNDLNLFYDDPRLGDVRRNYLDTTKALKILGWQAKVNLKHGGSTS